MAKITPSALISEIKGKLKGSVFQMWRGQICVRDLIPPHTSSKLSKYQFQGVINTLSGCHYSLTNQQKNDWISYADLLPTQMSGFNAFLARNSTNLLADHADLVFKSNAPGTYNPPSTPSPFSVSYLISDDCFSLSWTSPALSCLYVQGYYAPQVGYDQKKFPPFRMIKTVTSSATSLSLDASPMDHGRHCYFRVRTLNLVGEPSAWSNTLITYKV